MFQEIILVILPVLFAGLTFIYYLKWNKIALLNTPLDFGFKINGKRVFGENKTIKGPIIMGIFTAVYGYIIFRLIENFQHKHIDSPYLFLALLIIGVSYSLGELPNSFIKRQLGIIPGSIPTEGLPKYIFRIVDTFDSLLLVGLLYYLLFHFSILSIICAILLGGVIHLITDKLMMHLRLKGQFN
jgi:hypothetical protein